MVKVKHLNITSEICFVHIGLTLGNVKLFAISKLNCKLRSNYLGYVVTRSSTGDKLDFNNNRKHEEWLEYFEKRVLTINLPP